MWNCVITPTPPLATASRASTIPALQTQHNCWSCTQHQLSMHSTAHSVRSLRYHWIKIQLFTLPELPNMLWYSNSNMISIYVRCVPVYHSITSHSLIPTQLHNRTVSLHSPSILSAGCTADTYHSLFSYQQSVLTTPAVSWVCFWHISQPHLLSADCTLLYCQLSVHHYYNSYSPVNWVHCWHW